MDASIALQRRPQTKQEYVYRTLRDAIIRGELEPGQRLRTEEIAQRLGVSPIPVREALQLLQSERLVETMPHVGARVAGISHASIVEVFTVMEGLEIVATRTAAERVTSAQMQELGGLLEAMDRAMETGNYDEWGDQNSAFHRAIARMSGMPMLREMTERALDQWDRVRHRFLRGVLTQRLAQAQQEHHLIVRAMRARDAAQLERLVKDHNQGALAAYMEHLTQTELSTAA